MRDLELDRAGGPSANYWLGRKGGDKKQDSKREKLEKKYVMFDVMRTAVVICVRQGHAVGPESSTAFTRFC